MLTGVRCELKILKMQSFAFMRPSVHVVSDKQVLWVFRRDMSLLRLTFGSIVKLYSTMKFKAINGVKPSNAGLIWLLKFQLACSSLDSSLKGKLPQPRSSSLSTGSTISLPLLYLSPTCFAISLSNKDLWSDLFLPADPLQCSSNDRALSLLSTCSKVFPPCWILNL